MISLSPVASRASSAGHVRGSDGVHRHDHAAGPASQPGLIRPHHRGDRRCVSRGRSLARAGAAGGLVNSKALNAHRHVHAQSFLLARRVQLGLSAAGQSNEGPSPVIAADYARSLGITVAVATIGPPSAFRPGEVTGMAGNDASLIFAVSDWNALKTRDSTLVRNLTSMVSQKQRC